MSVILNVTIPLVVMAYAVYLIIHLRGNRKGGCKTCSGCSSCPMSAACHMAKQIQKENEHVHQ